MVQQVVALFHQEISFSHSSSNCHFGVYFAIYRLFSSVQIDDNHEGKINQGAM